MNTNQKLATLVACVAAACLLAACGSASSSSSSAAASAGAGAAAGRSKLVACLKQHGVTLPSHPGGFRRPNSGSSSSGSGTPPAGGYAGGGFFGGGFGGGSGARFRNNPKLQAAFKACGASFSAHRFNFANRKVEIDKFVKCVRQHGYDLPTPNVSGTGPVFPRSIESNKKFETAARSCASLLAPRGGPPPAGQQTTASSTA
ncbi:MAG: hypothetical protein ACLPTJ_00845 [Solirubrobacteraceae bacterium]